jgi:hypothetical protein
LVVRAEVPKDSGLPDADPERFMEVKLGLEFIIKNGDVVCEPRDRSPQPASEPMDIDVLARADGPKGVWVKAMLLCRQLKPLGVPAGTGTLVRVHELDWSSKEPATSVYVRMYGEPEYPHVDADVYCEYSLVGREVRPDGSWYMIVRYRWRLRSDHPDWEVSETEMECPVDGLGKITVPLFASESG